MCDQMRGFAGSPIDRMPTLIGLAGQSPTSPIDGRSVAEALLDGREPDPRPVLAEIASQRRSSSGPRIRSSASHVMVRDGD